eukprot:5371137-Amphidinium_carterae.1
MGGHRDTALFSKLVSQTKGLDTSYTAKYAQWLWCGKRSAIAIAIKKTQPILKKSRRGGTFSVVEAQIPLPPNEATDTAETPMPHTQPG